MSCRGVNPSHPSVVRCSVMACANPDYTCTDSVLWGVFGGGVFGVCIVLFFSLFFVLRGILVPHFAPLPPRTIIDNTGELLSK